MTTGTEGPGFFASLWRFFTFYKWRKSLGLIRAADRQFTGSVGGISDAYDLQHDKLVKQYQGLRDAVAQVEAVLEDKRQRLSDLNEEENTLIGRREGAIASAERAKVAGDNDAFEKHKAAFSRFDERINEIEELQKRIEVEISQQGEAMKRYLLKLTEMQVEVQKLPQDKAQAIADYVSNSKIIELNDQILGLQSSIDRGPIEAVRKMNRELSAKAKISEKLAGTDVRLQDEEYAREGMKAKTGDRFNAILATRAAEKKAKETAGSATAVKEDDRPKI